MASPDDLLRPPPTLKDRWEHLKTLGAFQITVGLLCCAHWWLTLSSLVLLAAPEADRSVFWAHPFLVGPTPFTPVAAVVVVVLALGGLIRAHRLAWNEGTKDPRGARAAAGYTRGIVAAALLAATFAFAQQLRLWVFPMSWVILSAITVSLWVVFVLGVRRWLQGEGFGLERRVQSTRWLRTSWALKWQARLVVGWGWWIVNVPLAASVGAMLANGVDTSAVRLTVLVIVTLWLAWDTWAFHDEVISRGSAF